MATKTKQAKGKRTQNATGRTLAGDERIQGQRIRCYDSGPNKGADRYTVVYMDRAHSGGGKLYPCVGMSASPLHPQGIGQHSDCILGRHLGKRIRFRNLPEDCRKLVLRDLEPEPGASTSATTPEAPADFTNSHDWNEAQGRSTPCPAESVAPLEISFHRDDTGQPAHAAINVKVYGRIEGVPDSVPGDVCEGAWMHTEANWWQRAGEIAHEHGYSGVFSEGRCGGWCVPFRQYQNGVLVQFDKWPGEGPKLGYPVYPDVMDDAAERKTFVEFRAEILALLEDVPQWYRVAIKKMMGRWTAQDAAVAKRALLEECLELAGAVIAQDRDGMSRDAYILRQAKAVTAKAHELGVQP